MPCLRAHTHAHTARHRWATAPPPRNRLRRRPRRRRTTACTAAAQPCSPACVVSRARCGGALCREAGDEVVDDGGVERFGAHQRPARRSEHTPSRVAHAVCRVRLLEDGEREGGAAEVVHAEGARATQAAVELSVRGARARDGRVDELDAAQPRALTRCDERVARRGARADGRGGDGGEDFAVAQRVLCGVLERGEQARRELLGAVRHAVHAHERRGVGASSARVGHNVKSAEHARLTHTTQLVRVVGHTEEARVSGDGRGAARKEQLLRRLPDEHLAAVGEGHDRRRRALALRILDDARRALLDNGNARARPHLGALAEVDAHRISGEVRVERRRAGRRLALLASSGRPSGRPSGRGGRSCGSRSGRGRGRGRRGAGTHSLRSGARDLLRLSALRRLDQHLRAIRHDGHADCLQKKEHERARE
jgi:hypothetical protein